MVASENDFSCLNHFLHLLWRGIAPTSFRNRTCFLCRRMDNIEGRTTTARPRHVVIPPNTSVINVAVTNELFRRMVFGKGSIELPKVLLNLDIVRTKFLPEL